MLQQLNEAHALGWRCVALIGREEDINQGTPLIGFLAKVALQSCIDLFASLAFALLDVLLKPSMVIVGFMIQLFVYLADLRQTDHLPCCLLFLFFVGVLLGSLALIR